MKSPILLAEWILRIAVCMIFAGHGGIALLGNESWLPYLTFWGFEVESAIFLLPFIGTIDLIVALLVLLKPFKAVVLWAVVWAFATALMRPLTGQNMLEFIERGGNFLAPLALYFLLNFKANSDSDKS